MMSNNHQQQRGRDTAKRIRYRSELVPSEVQEGALRTRMMREVWRMKAAMADVRELPGLFEQFRQDIVDEIMDLYVNFESLHNDLKYRCDNLQAALINVQEMRQLDRAKHSEALTVKEEVVAQLTKKLQHAEKQLQVREKTDLLRNIRTSSETEEIVRLNERITQLLDVIQAGNHESGELKTRLRQLQTSSTQSFFSNASQKEQQYRQELYELQLKADSLNKELEDYKLENCQLAQQIKKLKFGNSYQSVKVHPSSPSPKPMMKKVPRIDISLNEIDEPKMMQKPYISKQIGSHFKKTVKENVTQLRINSTLDLKRAITQPYCPQTTTRKVRIKNLIENISRDTPTNEQHERHRTYQEYSPSTPLTQRLQFAQRLQEFSNSRSQMFQCFISSLRDQPAHQ